MKEHLRAVVDIERQRTALFLLRARAGAVCAHLVVTLAFGSAVSDGAWEAMRPYEMGYALFAVAVLLVGQLAPGFLLPSGFLIALVDIPAVTAMVLKTAPHAARPDAVMAMSVPLALALIVGSGLTLNYVAIALAEISGCVATAVLAWRLGASVPQSVTAICACLGCGITTSFLVSRVRALVEESRRRDLGGKYIIGQQIGIGGMAEVFEATYSPAGGFERRVAVKRMLPAFAHSEEAVALFRREAAVGAMMAHPNIVQVLDFGCDGTSHFLAMELVDGTSLQRIFKLLQRTGDGLPIPAFVALAKMMFDALDHIHTRTDEGGAPLSLIHRDVNPPNILISRQGEAKLGDFGVARYAACEGFTRTGTFRGKVRYAAPEQLAHAEVNARSDLFALGITLHEALTGRRLFNGNTDALLAEAVVRQPIPHVFEVRPGLNPLIGDLIAHLLERDPAKRCASAADAARRLAQLPELCDLADGRKQLAALVEAARAVAPVPAAEVVTVSGLQRDATTRSEPVRLDAATVPASAV